MSLTKAIKKTQRYFSYFNYQPTLSEVHHWLISSTPHSLEQVREQLPDLPPSRPDNPSVVYKTRLAKDLVDSLLCHIPTIRMVAITGSVAANNANDQDDIDLMIVTMPHTLWLTRPIVVFLLKLRSLRRPPLLPDHSSLRVQNLFCDNLWLDEMSLRLPEAKQSLYTAHEVLQVVPLYESHQTYSRFIGANSWAGQFFKNAYLSIHRQTPSSATTISALPYIFVLLNYFSFCFQYLYMKPKITTEDVSLHAAYFHPVNPSHDIDNYLQ